MLIFLYNLPLVFLLNTCFAVPNAFFTRVPVLVTAIEFFFLKLKLFMVTEFLTCFSLCFFNVIEHRLFGVAVYVLLRNGMLLHCYYDVSKWSVFFIIWIIVFNGCFSNLLSMKNSSSYLIRLLSQFMFLYCLCFKMSKTSKAHK